MERDNITITNSAAKQISMIGKINAPFKLSQVCIKKGIKKETYEEFKKTINEKNLKLIFISREYDGTERYWLGSNTETKIDTKQFNDEIIFL